MSAEPLRVRTGLIGYGYAGKTFHAPLIQSVPGLQLTVVGSRKRDAVLAAYPGVLVCGADEVPTHPEVDLVVIASPNDSHYPLAAAALRAGKHVVLDKPFTVTLAEARSLREIAGEHGRLLSVFHNRRWESEIQATKAVLASGALGEVSHYECHIDRFRPVVRERWRENPGPGAGLWLISAHTSSIRRCIFSDCRPLSTQASASCGGEGGPMTGRMCNCYTSRMDGTACGSSCIPRCWLPAARRARCCTAPAAAG